MDVIVIPITRYNVKRKGNHPIKNLIVHTNNQIKMSHQVISLPCCSLPGKSMLIFHVAQHHNHVKFDQFKLFIYC
jgi:hypothetical protein